VDVLSVLPHEWQDFDLVALLAEIDRRGVSRGFREEDRKFAAYPFEFNGLLWRVPRFISSFRFDAHAYSYEAATLPLDYRFDAAVLLNELDAERFNEALTSRLVSRKNLRSRFKTDRKEGSVHLFAAAEALEPGSIKQRVYVGILAVGAFVSNYPSLKQGVLELYSDASFIAEMVESSLRAAKIPNDPEDDNPKLLGVVERRRRITADERKQKNA
jgi:hypothetical protein